jgi:hypothetical protein
MTLTKGTLVRIIDDAVSPNPDSEMRRQITNHGHLWVIDEPIRGIQNGNRVTSPRKWYWCKALSSGMVYDWNEDEFETEGGDDAHPAG